MVKLRNSKIKIKPNAGIKFDPNETIDFYSPMCNAERDFVRRNPPSTLRRVKPQKLALFRAGTQINFLRTRACLEPWKNPPGSLWRALSQFLCSCLVFCCLFRLVRFFNLCFSLSMNSVRSLAESNLHSKLITHLLVILALFVFSFFLPFFPSFFLSFLLTYLLTFFFLSFFLSYLLFFLSFVLSFFLSFAPLISFVPLFVCI